MNAQSKHLKILRFLGLLVAGICLFRVFSVTAAEDPYSSIEESSAVPTENGNTTEVADKESVRLTRPDEADGRVLKEDHLVPGIEHLTGAEPKRSIASDISVPTPAAAQDLPADLIIPKRLQAQSNLTTQTQSQTQSQVMNRSVAGLEMTKTQPLDIMPMEPHPISSYGVREMSIIVSEYGFFPNRIFVTQNTPVKLYLSTPSKSTMCFMLDRWGLKKGVAPGKIEEISFVPSMPGNYRFYCPMYSIEGTVTVKEPATEASSLVVLSPLPAQREISSEGIEKSINYNKSTESGTPLKMIIEE